MSKAKRVRKYKKDRIGQKYSFNLKIYKLGGVYRLHKGARHQEMFDKFGYTFDSLAEFCVLFERITGIKLKENDLRKYKVTFERIPLEN